MNRKITLSVGVVALYAIYLAQGHLGGDSSAQSLNLSPTATPLPTIRSTPDDSGSVSPPTLTPTPTPAQQSNSSGNLKNGQYTGSTANAFYGMLQVKATISGGKLSDISFLQYPNDRGHTIEVSQMSLPVLRQEAISAQSSQVDVVSGATDTSEAFMQSLGDALSQAGGS